METIQNNNEVDKIILNDEVLESYTLEKQVLKDKKVYDIKAKDNEPFRISLDDKDHTCFHNVVRISFTEIWDKDNLSLWSNEGIIYSTNINDYTIDLSIRLSEMIMKFKQN